MADYPVQPHNTGGADTMSMDGGGNQMQPQSHQMAAHQHMMGQQQQQQQQMQQPQMVPMRGGPSQAYHHGMSAAPGLIHARQQSSAAGNFRPHMMRPPIDQQQQRFAYVNTEQMHQMGMMSVGGPQQQHLQQTAHLSQSSQSQPQHQQQIIPSPQMMNQSMQPQMVGMPMKLAPGQVPMTFNQAMSQGTVIHRATGQPVTFRQPLVRQAMDPRMAYMTSEQMQHMERVRMQNMIQHQQMQNSQARAAMPGHQHQQHQQQSSQAPQAGPSSSALRQALGYAGNPTTAPSQTLVSAPSHAQVPTPTPGGPISVNSSHSLAESTSSADKTSSRERQLSTTSIADYKTSFANINPKLASEPVVTREALDRMVKAVDPTETLEDDVADAICVMMDEFIDNVIDVASRVARHRGGTHIEGRDVAYTLEHFFDMPMTADGFCSGSQAVTSRSRAVTNDAHQQRMALIKKTLKKP